MAYTNIQNITVPPPTPPPPPPPHPHPHPSTPPTHPPSLSPRLLCPDANYRGLQEVWDKYHEYGLEVLAFPCNQVWAP